ncbi:hypothetical protein HU200_018032 [Digitaria exilis]|uniref:UspA domain-containing protein n=1 Tax=Digitaria exilis TaxID=1010633 RepID=A0A835F584_9POAL|nr:hypothetical protein HU200_018032 [Digitaria exilis]
MHALTWCLSNVVVSAAAAPPPAVVLVHARSPRPFYDYPVDGGAGYIPTQQVMDTMDQYMASAADTVVAKAKTICTALFPSVRVETCVEKGDPRDVICGAAEKADMVVMGSHGYGFLQRALLGSVSNHCVHNCKCPVVVVKRPDGGSQRRPCTSKSRLAGT